MADPLLCLVIFLAMVHLSSGDYCICNTGLSDTVLQSNIDYACGAGADCTPIMQNGACYIPNTVRDHCNFAVNSYYQRRSQAPGTCNFSGTATTTQTIPNQTPGCVYPSNGGNGTTPRPPSGPPGSTPSVPPGSTPSGPPGSTPPGPPGSTPPPPSPFLISPPGPDGNGNGSFNNNAATATTVLQPSHLFYSFTLTLTLLLHGLMLWTL